MASTSKRINIDYTTTDPRKIAAQTRQQVADKGDELGVQNAFQAQRAEDQTYNTQNYLNRLESPLAYGYGGYNDFERSQILMTPEQQQDIVTSAGISAGLRNAAGVNAAQRAANAAGGNPLALAAYRARAAQQEAADAGDAMTTARVAASNAAAQRAEDVGQARIGQQNQALGYYGGLQAQQNANAQNAYNRQQQTYATQTGGLTGTGNLGLQASQTPSTFDKIMGGIGGALSFLEDGDVTPRKTPAVVGENGPEKVVDLSDRRADRLFLDDGDIAPPPNVTVPLNDYVAGNSVLSALGTPKTVAPRPSIWRQFGSNLRNNLVHSQGQTPPVTQTSTPAGAMQSFGQGVGRFASLFLEDGDVMPQGANGIFTKPTRVNLHPNEAVVPLSYRAGAKVRPSLAALPAARTRAPYGGFHGRI